MEPLEKYRLRPAKAKDCEVIFTIRNQKQVRENSFNPNPIEFAGHQKWYENSLKNNKRQILVMENGKQVCGVLRFDIENEAAEISLYLDPAYFGQGLGRMLLEKGIEWLESTFPLIKTLKAKILASNLPSADLFAKNGFESRGGIWIKTL